VHSAVGPPGESAMNTWRLGIAAGVIASAMVLGLASCGDDDNDTSAAAPPQVDPDPLRLDIQAATVPDFATTARPTVTFRVLDGSNNPIDLEAELATTTSFPNLTSPGRAPTFTIAMLTDNDDYVSYYSTTRAGASYAYIADPEVIGTDVPFVPPTGTYDGTRVTFTPAPTRTQATSAAVTRTNITRVGDRTYQFTFPAAGYSTANMDRTKTHTVAGWLVRRPNGGDTDIGFGSLNFIPAGGGTARKLETITDEGCNRCHGALTAHGTRRGTQFCITCHSPQTGDPETDRSVDFKQMIHKIHYGSGLPSVRQGKPYFIVGNGQSVHDWSDVAFPWHDHGVQHCTVCHTGANADNWRTKPSINACGSCHDNVKFTTTAGLDPCPVGTQAAGKFADCIHAGGLFPTANPSDPNACVGCHGPGTIAAVDKFHHGD
jgi:OmcA/MtrC family decaheme c-type cytochrome